MNTRCSSAPHYYYSALRAPLLLLGAPRPGLQQPDGLAGGLVGIDPAGLRPGDDGKDLLTGLFSRDRLGRQRNGQLAGPDARPPGGTSQRVQASAHVQRRGTLFNLLGRLPTADKSSGVLAGEHVVLMHQLSAIPCATASIRTGPARAISAWNTTAAAGRPARAGRRLAGPDGVDDLRGLSIRCFTRL